MNHRQQSIFDQSVLQLSNHPSGLYHGADMTQVATSAPSLLL